MTGASPHRSPVLITDTVVPECLELLRAEPAIEVRYRPGLKGEELLHEIADCEALIVRSKTKVTSDFLEQAPQLKVIGRPGTGTPPWKATPGTSRSTSSKRRIRALKGLESRSASSLRNRLLWLHRSGFSASSQSTCSRRYCTSPLGSGHEKVFTLFTQ